MSSSAVHDEPAWYAAGLRFECVGCGRCCTGGPGYIWISRLEITRLSAHLRQPVPAVQSLFCRKLSGGVSLKEKRPNAAGQYDCIFLMDDNKALAPDGSDGVHQQRKCGVYEARPLQCRTWPFWPGNLASREAWEEAAGTCPGINRGRLWTLDEIIARRDARDWPE